MVPNNLGLRKTCSPKNITKTLKCILLLYIDNICKSCIVLLCQYFKQNIPAPIIRYSYKFELDKPNWKNESFFTVFSYYTNNLANQTSELERFSCFDLTKRQTLRAPKQALEFIPNVEIPRKEKGKI